MVLRPFVVALGEAGSSRAGKTCQAYRRIRITGSTNTLGFGNNPAAAGRGRDPSQRWVRPPISIATKAILFMRQDTNKLSTFSIVSRAAASKSSSSSSSNPATRSDSGVASILRTDAKAGFLSRRDKRTEPGVLTPGTDKKRPAPKVAVEPLSQISADVPKQSVDQNILRPLQGASWFGPVPGV